MGFEARRWAKKTPKRFREKNFLAWFLIKKSVGVLRVKMKKIVELRGYCDILFIQVINEENREHLVAPGCQKNRGNSAEIFIKFRVKM